eukprot:GILK01010440.1.p1 GENE.GILK01010440.1~~GILK01010440.1.p1  ORF type:complete len:502 (-),score=68.50 GILK01010440.1:55-1509(-)
MAYSRPRLRIVPVDSSAAPDSPKSPNLPRTPTRRHVIDCSPKNMSNVAANVPRPVSATPSATLTRRSILTSISRSTYMLRPSSRTMAMPPVLSPRRSKLDGDDSSVFSFNTSCSTPKNDNRSPLSRIEAKGRRAASPELLVRKENQPRSRLSRSKSDTRLKPTREYIAVPKKSVQYLNNFTIMFGEPDELPVAARMVTKMKVEQIEKLQQATEMDAELLERIWNEFHSLRAYELAMADRKSVWSSPSRNIMEDNTVSKLGFFKILKRLGVRNMRMVDRLFKSFDIDRSGSIDFREFCQFVGALRPGPTKEKLQLLFRAYDLNNDGMLQRSEYLHMVNTALYDYTNQEEVARILRVTSEVFDTVDSDRSGCIKWAGFEALLDEYTDLEEFFETIIIPKVGDRSNVSCLLRIEQSVLPKLRETRLNQRTGTFVDRRRGAISLPSSSVGSGQNSDAGLPSYRSTGSEEKSTPRRGSVFFKLDDMEEE